MYGKWVIAGIVLVGTACGDSTGVEVEDLAGRWEAQSFVFRSIGNPGVVIDVIGDLGASFTLVIDADGTIETTFVLDGSTDTDSGTIRTVGNAVTISIGGDPASGTITRSEDTVTIELISGVEFDFDDDGTDDAATAAVVLRRS